MNFNDQIVIFFAIVMGVPLTTQAQSHTLGNKSYEASNHLGNVMAMVNDRKTPTPETTNTTIAFNETDIKSFNDYYPYGMLLENRNDAANYRFGFQGQEKDNEVKGVNNSVNYKYRVHDPRLGRFFAVDPLSSKYPHNSTYAFSENNVIHAIELEGLEKYIRIEYKIGKRIIAVEYAKVQNNTLRNYFKTVNITNTTNDFQQLAGILDDYPNPDYQADLGGGGKNGWVKSKMKNIDSLGFYSQESINNEIKLGRLINAGIKDSLNKSVQSYKTETNSNGSHLLTSSLLAHIRFQRDVFTLPINDLQNNEYLNEILNYAQTLENLNNPNLSYTINITGMASRVNKPNQGGNLQLSINRANFIRQYFINNGIPTNRLNTSGVSTSNSTGNNTNDRRVDVGLDVTIRSQ